MSHNTAVLVASFQAAPPVPADSRERLAVNGIKGIAVDALPQVPAELLGDVMMHCVSFFDSVIDALRESDPMLDWESLATLTHNILGVAGMELYTGAELGASEAAAVAAPQAERGACEGCGCCSRAGCHRLADSTCPTNSLGDSVCPCTED